MRVNLGCGRSVMAGWVNVDLVPGPGVDLVLDLDRPDRWKFDFWGVTEWRAEHLIEHIRHPLWLWEAMWEASVPGATAWFACPHGGSDDAWSDPTHVRPMFEGSWSYASAPSYWKADYGYRGDWHVDMVTLTVPKALTDAHGDGAYELVRRGRNFVSEMQAEMTAIKPARPPDAELREPVNVTLLGVE